MNNPEMPWDSRLMRYLLVEVNVHWINKEFLVKEFNTDNWVEYYVYINWEFVRNIMDVNNENSTVLTKQQFENRRKKIIIGDKISEILEEARNGFSDEINDNLK